MTRNDLDQVYAIEHAVHIAPWSKEILSDCIEVGYDCRVLEEGSIVCGYIICRNTDMSCHILNLCIGKAYQALGYGRILLSTVLDELKKHTQITQVDLEVRPTNKIALTLYESLGFTREGISKEYYRSQAGTEDAIILKKSINR